MAAPFIYRFIFGGLSDDTLSHHSIGNLLEARDVGAGNQVVAKTGLSGGPRKRHGC